MIAGLLQTVAKRRFVQPLMLMLVASGGACSDSTGSLRTRPADWEVILRSPGEPFMALAASADGAVFAISPQSLYRHIPGETDRWVRVAVPAEESLELFAASRESVFATARLSGSMQHWNAREGWKLHQTILSDSAVAVGSHVIVAFGLNAIWGRSASDVYAAGTGGSILHYDGQSWQREPNPLATPAPRGSPVSADFWSIAGTADRAYAATGGAVLEKQGGQWRQLHPPAGIRGAFDNVAAAGSDMIFVGSHVTEQGDKSRVVRLRSDGQWEVLDSPGVWAIIDAQSQPGGSALLWAMSHLVAEVANGRVWVHRLPHIGRIAGAIRVGEFLFVGGYKDSANSTEGMILRARTPLDR